MVGFLSTILVLITSLKDSYFYRKYKQYGHLTNFLFYYFFTTVSLFITHLLTIAALAGYGWFKAMLSSVVMNVFQIIFIIMVSHSVSIRSKSTD